MFKISREVLERVADGDEKMFTRLYLRCANGVAFYIDKFIKDMEESILMTCELFADVPKLIKRSYDYKKGNFTTWLYRIARNRAFTYLKMEAPTNTISFEEVIGSIFSFTIEYDSFNLEELKKYLTEDEYFFIESMYGFEFSFAEVCQLMKISERRGRYLHYCARKKIKKFYIKNFYNF